MIELVIVGGIAIISLAGLLGWKEYLTHTYKIEQDKRLYRFVDDMFDRKNAGTFAHGEYVYGKKLKEEQTQINFSDIAKKQKEKEAEFPAFINQAGAK